MYFYLAMVGFEPTLTSTAVPSNTETTVIPSRPLRSLLKELSWPRFMLYFLCNTRRIYIYIHVYDHFQRSSSLKLPGQSKPNFM